MKRYFFITLLAVMVCFVGTDVCQADDFYFSDISFTQSSSGYVRALGEITNNTSERYKLAYFTLNLYDRLESLLAVETIIIQNFSPGQTKSFSELIGGIGAEDIDRYKIYFDHGYEDGGTSYFPETTAGTEGETITPQVTIKDFDIRELTLERTGSSSYIVSGKIKNTTEIDFSYVSFKTILQTGLSRGLKEGSFTIFSFAPGQEKHFEASIFYSGSSMAEKCGIELEGFLVRR